MCNIFISKGKCPQCHRPIQNTLHDKCMYCDAPLSKEQRFSAKEKEEISKNISAQEARHEKQKKEAQKYGELEYQRGNAHWSGDFSDIFEI